MPRYSLFEGVPGYLCAHPSARAGSRRHPGMRRRELAEGEDFVALVDLYEPLAEVHEEHRCLAKAVAAGHLKRLAGPVVAKDVAAALELLKPVAPAKPKAPKGGGID